MPGLSRLSLGAVASTRRRRWPLPNRPRRTWCWPQRPQRNAVDGWGTSATGLSACSAYWIVNVQHTPRRDVEELRDDACLLGWGLATHGVGERGVECLGVA